MEQIVMLRRTAECLWVRPPPPFPVRSRLTCSFEQIVQHPHIRLIHTKGRGFFLSINQEGQALDTFCVPQSVVCRLVEESGGFERSYRFPHWMRAGYVEELYRIC
jgi:hypothetical protein